MIVRGVLQVPGYGLSAVTVMPSVATLMWLKFDATLHDKVHFAASQGNLLLANGHLEETAIVRYVQGKALEVSLKSRTALTAHAVKPRVEQCIVSVCKR